MCDPAADPWCVTPAADPWCVTHAADPGSRPPTSEFYPYEDLMEYDICERFCLMAQTALFNEHLPNVTAAATDTAKQVIVYF